ncbi:hypothetical protein ACWKX9_25630 [Enterobacter asburiae]
MNHDLVAAREAEEITELLTLCQLLPVATILSAIGAGMERRGEISVLPGEDYAQKALVRLSEQYPGTKEDKP